MSKFYITTSIAYANAKPHIGFALELIQADVLARYHRLSGDDVFYLTGTDEHGLKIKRAAEKAGKEPQKFVDEISQKFRELTEVLNISNDDFIRTTDEKRHWPSVEKFWLELEKRGDIYKKKYKGMYCSGCEAFLTKRDLKDGKCPSHKKEPEIIEEENYFFKLSKYLNRIKKKIESNELKIVPEKRKKEVLGYIKTGIDDVSFSRSKEKYWGFPVPKDDSQIVYVWGDALLNYISAIGYEKETSQFLKFWPAEVHCIGKDILKFHSIIWPGMLLSAGLNLPKSILVHGFITVGGEKMSKSIGNVIDPFDLVKKYGTDAVRYFLLREIPTAEDGDFTFEKFEARYNSDLASGIGNLNSRVIKMADNLSLASNQVEEFFDLQFKKRVLKAQDGYKKALNDFKFNEALISVWSLIGFCDKYIEKEKPWEIDSENLIDKNKKVINDLLIALKEIAALLRPFLPETSEKIEKRQKEPLFLRIK